MRADEQNFRKIAYMGVCYLEERAAAKAATVPANDTTNPAMGKPDTRDELRKEIQQLAEFYRVPIKPKNVRVPFPVAFKAFLLNKTGYVETLPALYNSIL